MPGEPIPAEIIVQRAKVNTLCSACFKTDVNAKRCEGVSGLDNMRTFKVDNTPTHFTQCKLAWYCSKEVSPSTLWLQVSSFTFSLSFAVPKEELVSMVRHLWAGISYNTLGPITNNLVWMLKTEAVRRGASIR